MTHGHPDYGIGSPTKTIYTLEDLAELAVRLGSPVIFDRRGNVVAIDDFESGIGKWGKSGEAGYSFDWNGNYAKTGGFSGKLTTGTVAGNTISLYKHTGVPVLSSLGLEVSFAYEQNWRSLASRLVVYDGTYAYTAEILYDHVNEKLQYLDSSGNPQDIPDGSYQSGDEPYKFDTLKFVGDFTTAKYKRLIVNNREFDLSAISFQKSAYPYTPILIASIKLITNVNAAAIGYIDDVILTQNEP